MDNPTNIPKKDNNLFTLNPHKQPLTPGKLRELSGLEVTDAEADEIIHSIRLFCKVLWQFHVSRNIDYIKGQSEDNTGNNIQKEAA